jgi:hypothetical protein
LFAETVTETNDIQGELNEIKGSEADSLKQKLRSGFGLKGFSLLQDFMCVREVRAIA